MINSIKFPLFLKATILLVGIFFLLYAVSIGQQIIIPLVYAFIISVLLTPLVNFLERKKVNRVVAITIAVILAFFFVVALFYFIASQLSRFNNALPMMRQKLSSMQDQAGQWIAIHFDVSIQSINAWFIQRRHDIMDNGNAMLGKTILTLTGTLIAVFVVPVYVFMILYYEPLLLLFIKKLFDKTHHEKLVDVMLLTKKIIQSYLVGLLIEAVIVAAMNSTALIIIGVDYAILLGIIGALLNMIPFIGGILAVALPMIVALITKDGYYSLLVLAAYLMIQFIDNHYITPKIVASKVSINALVALIVVLVGNALWGIPGMFLAIPVTGILKVVFEHIDSMKPWALLLGDDMPASGKYIFNFSRKRPAVLSKQDARKA